MNDINLYYIKNLHEKTDVEALRELAKKTYANCRKLTTNDTYDLDIEGKIDKYFYGNGKFELGYLEKVLYECANILYYEISYRPQKEQLKQIMMDLKTGTEDYFKTSLVEDVINDSANLYFKEDEELLDSHLEEPVFHMEYIIKKFKPMVNIICKVLNENDLEGRIFRI